MFEEWPYYHPIYGVFAFLIGACIGSLLNVCIYRIPKEESIIFPASHCKQCKKSIAWYDNIPLISYVLLNGKCRNCKMSFSIRYMLVEFLTAVLFLRVWLFYETTWVTLIYGVFIFGLILGSFIDIDHMIIPDRVTWGGIGLGLLFSFMLPEMHNAQTKLQGLFESFAGATLGFGLLWLVSIIGRWAFKKDAMGFGDVKLIGAVGAFLGWQAVLFTILFSSFLGSAVGLIQIALNKRGWQTQIPYGPFIAMAAACWLFEGRQLWDIYVEWITNG